MFNPETHTISLFEQPESSIMLSASAVRLLQEFIRHNGEDLSREMLITHVWESFGFTPSGHNLSKTVSELRKIFQTLGESRNVIVTVPRFGFRFEADVTCYTTQQDTRTKMDIPIRNEKPTYKKRKVSRLGLRIGKLLILVVVLFILAGVSVSHFRRTSFTVPIRLAPENKKIGNCHIWMINVQEQPFSSSKMAKLLEENNIICQRDVYNIYYFSSSFTFVDVNEVFIGACPENKDSLCKTIRYKNGVRK
ncbi:winged helix-turn-helix domain-containing protein [Klebsiella aerogenes]|uniref:winged helix-turn-helix domain-containing protein n=1 Tax=Klebsiella aerogenes TaxID=548 RepID=UPI001D021231|nr:winged helix-turn-helix domain-containing protein [Klebsiella aerogenes]